LRNSGQSPKVSWKLLFRKVTQINLSIRTANGKDRQRLANLIHFETFVHRHLDWRLPLDWIDCHPYLIAERGQQLVAALACPPDPPDVAWIRLFAVDSEGEMAEAWYALWPQACQLLKQLPKIRIAAIPLQDWFRQLLIASQFILTNQVIMLSWERDRLPPTRESPPVRIRPMMLDDLPSIEILDAAAFAPLWHNSYASLEIAFRQAVLASVAELDGTIVAYQISTGTQTGGHLARLATQPPYQSRGIGSVLLGDTLTQFSRRGAQRVTVNTQQDNLSSIALYEKAGFKRTGESYPVYLYPD